MGRQIGVMSLFSWIGLLQESFMDFKRKLNQKSSWNPSWIPWKKLRMLLISLLSTPLKKFWSEKLLKIKNRANIFCVCYIFSLALKWLSLQMPLFHELQGWFRMEKLRKSLFLNFFSPVKKWQFHFK